MDHVAHGVGNNEVSAKLSSRSPGGAMLFDFVVVYNHSKWRTGNEV